MSDLTGIYNNTAAMAIRHHFNGQVDAGPVQYAMPQPQPGLEMSERPAPASPAIPGLDS